MSRMNNNKPTDATINGIQMMSEMIDDNINPSLMNPNQNNKLIQCGACFRSFHTQAQFGQHSRICREGKAVVRHLVQSQDYKYSYLEKQTKKKLEVKSRFVLSITEGSNWKKLSKQSGLNDGALKKLLQNNNICNVDVAIRQRKASGLIIANFIARNVVRNAQSMHNAKHEIECAVDAVYAIMPDNINMRLHLCKSLNCKELVIRDTEGFCSRHRAQKYHKRGNNTNHAVTEHTLSKPKRIIVNKNTNKSKVNPLPLKVNNKKRRKWEDDDEKAKDSKTEKNEENECNSATDEDVMVARLLTNLKQYSSPNMFHSDNNHKNKDNTNTKRDHCNMNGKQESSLPPPLKKRRLKTKKTPKNKEASIPKKTGVSNDNNAKKPETAQIFMVPYIPYNYCTYPMIGNPQMQMTMPMPMHMPMPMTMQMPMAMPMQIPAMRAVPYFVPVMSGINNSNSALNTANLNVLNQMNIGCFANQFAQAIPSFPLPSFPLLHSKNALNNNNNNSNNKESDDMSEHSQTTNNSDSP